VTFERSLVLDRLSAIPLFSEVEGASMQRVAELVTEFEAPAGHVLVQPGQPGSGMFVLEEGTVAVELPGRTLELGPGEFFGELSILADGIVRTARVRCASAVRCLAISRSDFAELLKREPRIAVSMLPVLARRLADAQG
jgi:CRP-like cAMP-binding protein